MSRSSCAPAGYRFPREVIAVAVRWYLRYGLSYREVEELLAERGLIVDHVIVYCWVCTFMPEFIDAARPARHAAGDRWFVEETYVKVAGRWTYLYRAVDQHGQVIDVLVSDRRDARAAHAFFTRALTHGRTPAEVTTDRAAVYPRVIEAFAPGAGHVLDQYANNAVQTDHGRLTARLRPMRGLNTIRSLRVVAAGHALVQNLRRGHYEIAVDLPARDRVRALDLHLITISKPGPGPPAVPIEQRNSAPIATLVAALSAASGGAVWDAVESHAGWGSWAVLRPAARP